MEAHPRRGRGVLLRGGCCYTCDFAILEDRIEHVVELFCELQPEKVVGTES